jgi:hypothetical protein
MMGLLFVSLLELFSDMRKRGDLLIYQKINSLGGLGLLIIGYILLIHEKI